MIDNIVLLITGTLHGRDISELLPKCHPLGMFESIGSLSIATTPAEVCMYVRVCMYACVCICSYPKQCLTNH